MQTSRLPLRSILFFVLAVTCLNPSGICKRDGDRPQDEEFSKEENLTPPPAPRIRPQSDFIDLDFIDLESMRNSEDRQVDKPLLNYLHHLFAAIYLTHLHHRN